MLKKLNILGIIMLTATFLCMAAPSVYAAYDPSNIEEMSVAKFWRAVNGYDAEVDEEKEYLICGGNVCDTETQECLVLVSEREEVATKIAKILDKIGSFGIEFLPTIGDVIIWVRGEGKVYSYEYKCVMSSGNEISQLTSQGWKVATEGGFVQKQKIRTEGAVFKGTQKEETCYSDSTGKTYCLLTKEKGGELKKATVGYGKDNTAFQTCEVIPVKLYQNRKCFFCPLFTIPYAIANHITSISFGAFAKAFAQLIALGLAIWVSYQTLNHVSSITKQDAGKFLYGLLKQSYKFLIAFFLLIYSVEIYNYAIIPIMKSGIKFGSLMLSEKYAVVKTNSEQKITNWEKMEEINPGITKRSKKITLRDGDTRYYSSELYVELDNFIAQLQRTISFMQVTGSSMICVGGNAIKFKGNVLGFGDGIQLIIEGIVLAGFAFLISISVAFYILDAIVQLGLVGALMPFLIACWPFKITSKYTNIGWNMFLNAVFLLMFTGVVITVSISLIEAALSYTAISDECTNGQCSIDSVKMGALYKIAQAINSQDEEKLENLTDISSIGFLILIFACIYGFMFVKKNTEFAGKFASGALSPIAPEVATIGGSAIKSMALKSTQSTREGIDRVAKRTASSVWDVATHPVRTAKNVMNFFGSSSNNDDNNEDGNDTSSANSSAGKGVRPKIGQSNTQDTKKQTKKPTVGEKATPTNGNEDNAEDTDTTEVKVKRAQYSGKRKQNTKAKNSSRKQRQRMQNSSRAKNRKNK